MKETARIAKALLFGLGGLMCFGAALALLLCVYCAISSPFLDDAKGPGPMDIPYWILAWGFGLFGLVAGMLGGFLVVVAKGIKFSSEPKS